MTYDDILNIIHREVARCVAARPRRVACIVDSYNPAQFTVKVRRQPEDTVTGWIQIEQLQTGASFGFQVAPNIGDPGWIDFHEGDGDAPVFIGASSNDLFPPVSIQAGELLCKTKWGSQFYFKNDGSLTLTDKGGASIAFDGAGNITMTGKAGQTIALDATGNITLTPHGSGQVQLGGTGGLPAARNNDAVPSHNVVASSTKVTVV